MSDVTCPLCDWTHEVAEATPAPGIATALGLPTESLALIHNHQIAQGVEDALDKHLRTHGPHDWLPALMEARRAAGIGGEGR